MRDRNNKPVSEFEEKVIQISRVSKKTKGGNKIGFSVLMVVGDKKGRVGVGLGKAGDVVGAMKKGIKKAKKKMITVPMDGTTIPFSIEVKKGAGRVLLKPAPKGSGVIAGGPIRAVVEAAGIRDISSKILGSENQASSVYATFEALKRIETLVAIKGLTLKSIAQIEAEEEKKLKELQAKAKAKKSDKKVNKKVDKKVNKSKTNISQKRSQNKAARPVAKGKKIGDNKKAVTQSTVAKKSNSTKSKDKKKNDEKSGEKKLTKKAAPKKTTDKTTDKAPTQKEVKKTNKVKK